MPGEEPRRRWLTLARAFLLLTAGTLAAVGLLLYGFLEASRRSTLETAQALRRDAALRVEASVTQDLGAAVETAQDLEAQIRLGVVDPADPSSVERALLAELIDRPTLSDAALTRATSLGYDADGHVQVGPGTGWELAAYRSTADPASPIRVRQVQRKGDGWTASVRERTGEASPAGAGGGPSTALDPTAAPTFVEAAARDQGGRVLWSDLHWSELDVGPPRRVVTTVQQAVFDAAGHFAGVVRVGLLTDRIDDVARVRVDGRVGAGADDPHRVFLCDPQGRLLSRLGPHDPLVLSGDDLRVDPRDAPPEVKAALLHPALGRAADSDDATDGDLTVGGRRYLVTFRALAGTQDWVVGIVVPEDHYTARLQTVRDRFLALYLAVAALALGGGLATARAVRRGLRRVDESTDRMRSLDFEPRPTEAPFRDVETVLDSLERAKTTMRALGKYAPLDLVRELVRTNREPKLGGAPADVTVMFSDIRGFTSLAEKATPDELAELLGAYLETMTAAIGAPGAPSTSSSATPSWPCGTCPRRSTATRDEGARRSSSASGRPRRCTRRLGGGERRRSSPGSACIPPGCWPGTSGRPSE